MTNLCHIIDLGLIGQVETSPKTRSQGLISALLCFEEGTQGGDRSNWGIEERTSPLPKFPNSVTFDSNSTSRGGNQRVTQKGILIPSFSRSI